MPGNKIRNAPENNSFALCFMDLKLGSEHKEDYMEVGESKTGWDYRIVKIICSLEGVQEGSEKRNFKDVLT